MSLVRVQVGALIIWDKVDVAPPFAKGGVQNLRRDMYYVYLLQSKNDNGFYIGYTDSIPRRFEQHLFGMVESTKDRRPLELVYYEAYITEKEARLREQKLKQFGSSYTGLLKRLGLKS